jgi:hypothetical protein
LTTTDLVRADLLASLEENGWLSSTALVIDRPDLSFEKYTALGVLLGKVGSAVKFWVGDWLLYGEALYGERAAEASEALNLSAEGRQDCIRVALAIPRSRRRPSLSWWHHRQVAARWLTLSQREQLLDAAEREGLTTRELEARVRDLRILNSDSRGATAATCEELLDQAAASLRERLVGCGFPDDLALTIEVAVPPGITIVTRVGP